MKRSVLGLWQATLLLQALTGIDHCQSLDEVQGRKLNGPMQPNGSVIRYSISDDEVHALYVADETVNGKEELFSVRLDTVADRVKLNNRLPAGGDVLFEASWQDRVVFVAPRFSDGTVELYLVPLDGGTPVVLNPPLVAGWQLRLGVAPLLADTPSACFRSDHS